MIELRDYEPEDTELITSRARDVLYWNHSVADTTDEAVTMLKDGHPVAICGISILYPGVASIWVICSDDVRGFGVSVVKVGRSLCDIWHEKFDIRRFQALVDVEIEENKKFAKVCGFEFEGVMRKVTIEGKDMELYARVY